MSQRQRRAPKRRIERVCNKISVSGATSPQDIVLHTAEDAKTLVRMMGHLNVIQDTAAAAEGVAEYEFLFEVQPNGNAVADAPDTSQALDQDCPEQELFRLMTAHLLDTALSNSDTVPIQLDFDSKAMRKLKAGDTVNLRHTGSGEGDDLFLNGIIYLWFKE